MRQSPRRHTLAVLRLLIGLTQKEMAALVGRSVVTIQKIELGKLRLGPELADEISGQTWVSLKWLLDGDIKMAPVAAVGGPYTKKLFELRQAQLQGNPGMGQQEPAIWAKFYISQQVAEYAAAAGAAVKQKKLELFNYKFRKAIESLKKEFGCEESIRSLEKLNQKATDDDKLLADSILAVGKLFRAVDTHCPKPVLASRQSSRAPRRRLASH